MKVGIAIDSWKFKIFKRQLKRAGYEFKKYPGVTPDTLTLTVETDKPLELQKVVAEANDLCASSRGSLH